jgi:hypothetical protein
VHACRKLTSAFSAMVWPLSADRSNSPFWN